MLVKYLGVDGQYLGLYHYTLMPHFFLFISFIQARGVAVPELVKQVQTALMVLAYLAKQQRAGAERELVQQCMGHLEGLRKELGGLGKRVRGLSTNPLVAVPRAGAVLEWQRGLVERALAAGRAEQQQQGGLIIQPSTHTLIRDATLLAMMFGHWGLVSRLSVVRTLRSARWASLPCGVEGCVGVECKGNRLEVVQQQQLALIGPIAQPCSSPTTSPTSSSTTTTSTQRRQLQDQPCSSSSSTPEYKVCVAHHKNSSKGVPGFEVIIHSSPLQQLLAMYEGCSRAQLLRLAGKEHEDPTTLFFHPNTALPLTEDHLGSWFKELQAKHQGCPLPPGTPPSHLRHIFASDRRERPGVAGPSDAGAALHMGNSAKVWSSHYHKNKVAKEVQDAADMMEDYRLACTAQYLEERGSEGTACVARDA